MTGAGERGPFTRKAGDVIEFENIVFAGSSEPVAISIANDRIAAITSVPGEAAGKAEWLCLPPLADLHVHANRAFTPPDTRPVGLADAARKVRAVMESFTQDDYYRQSCLLLEAARRHGTTRLRTHADLAVETGFQAVAGTLRAAEAIAGIVDVEVVAFSGPGSDPSTNDGRLMLKEAVSMGAGILGGAPAFCADQKLNIDAILDLAVELDVLVDLHLDEHLDPDSSFSEYLAVATVERGLQGRVTLSHGCAVSMLSDTDRARTIEQLAEACVTVIALPRTNLYLQDSGGHTPTLRGITPVREMFVAGVEVRFASDNVRDAFYPYGDADLLSVAMDGILGARFDQPEAVVAAICDGRYTVALNDPADFVLLPGNCLDAVLADPPDERWVVRAGKPVRVDVVSTAIGKQEAAP